MTITPPLFEAFLKCPTKCWLRFTGEAPAGNDYAEWTRNQNESFRATAAERLLASTPTDESPPPGSSGRVEAHYSSAALKTAKWTLALDVPVQFELRSSRGHEAQTSSPQLSTIDPQSNEQSLLTTTVGQTTDAGT